MSTRTITGTTKAWLTENSAAGPQDIAEGNPQLIQAAAYSMHDMTSAGWVLVGTAEVTLTVDDMDTVVTNQVAALRAQITNVRAEAENKATQLERQVQQLLAITLDSGATS